MPWHPVPHSVLAAAVALLLAGCGALPENDVVAKAGKLELTRDELLASISYRDARDSLTAASIYIEDWKEMAVLYQSALAAGVEEEGETQLLIRKAVRQITVQRYIDRMLSRASEEGAFAVDSDEIRAFYETFPSEFVCTEPHYAVERYYAASAERAARLRDLLLEEVRSPDDFHERVGRTAPDHAETNRALVASRLKPVRRLFLENERMKSLLEGMQPGAVSPVVALGDTLYVVMALRDRVGAGERLSLAQARKEIEELLTVEKQKQYYSTLLKQARETYK